MKLLKQPQAIFGFPPPSSGALQSVDHYIEQLALSLGSRNWDRDVREMLDLLPQVFLKLGEKVEIPVDCMKVLSHHMYIVYQAYLRDRNPQLDDLLQLDSEYAYHLLHLFLENSDYKPYNPIEKYKEALLTDPDWALRWCLEQNDSLFYPKVMKHLVGTKGYNARSAIVHHRLIASKLDRQGALADIQQRLPLLLTDPCVCLWLLEFYPELERRKLFASALKDPPYLLVWAEKHGREFEESIRRALLLHPAWLADYLNLTNPPDARDLWLHARSRCTNDLLLPWVEQYGKAAGWL